MGKSLVSCFFWDSVVVVVVVVVVVRELKLWTHAFQWERSKRANWSLRYPVWTVPLEYTSLILHFACYERGFTLQWWHFNVSLFVILFMMYVCVVYVFTCNVLLHLMRKEVYSDRLAGCHCQWRYREIGRRIIMNDAVDSTGWQRCLSDYPLQFAGVTALAKPAKSLYVVAERVITCS